MYTIREWAKDERPRERLEQLGAQSLSTAELLAILLRVGREGETAVDLARRLLQQFGGLAGVQRASFDDLRAVRGVGPAKAAQIKAALELGRRLQWTRLGDRPRITAPEDAAALLLYEMSGLEQEHLRALLLDTRHQVLKMHDVVRGSVNSAQVRIAEIFREAVRVNAVALILAHNHPSGDPTPSADDIALTRQAQEAGRLLDIAVLDHLIIADNRFVSLKARGLF
ncbi:MAG TPA: JAB domain-containing protein [Chloroflexi bacterium]|nr:JAB domain-containing protein [Chloroflexota bacterium]